MIKFRVVDNPAVVQRWHVQIVGANGEILAVTENFVSRDNADEAVERLRTADLLNAPVEDLVVPPAD